jgi:predicted nucleic acid-binding protein
LPDIICNTSPLQYLHQIGGLGLLAALAKQVIVPPAVVAELAAGKRLGIELPDVAALEWITIRRPTSAAALPLVSDLGPGETEVLMLALESPGAVVILDDGLARQVAETAGIPLTGTLGILRDAKTAGLISAVKPLLDQLQNRGFRLASRTRFAVLRQVGETT